MEISRVSIPADIDLKQFNILHALELISIDTYAPGGAGHGQPQRFVIQGAGDERLTQQQVAGEGIGGRHHQHDEKPRRDPRDAERPRHRQHRPAPHSFLQPPPPPLVLSSFDHRLLRLHSLH